MVKGIKATWLEDCHISDPKKEYRSYACELEPGDVTHFGTVDHIERFTIRGGQERVRVVFTNGDISSVKADSTFHTATT